MVKFKDYYATLGVARSATEKEIKSAYRKLARQHHPDANRGNKSSEEKFKEITEAYEVLKDSEKRRRYDMLGANWKDGSDFRPPPDMSGFNFDFRQFGDAGAGAPFSDFFEMLFGQTFGTGGMPGGGTAGGAAGRARRGMDQEAEIELSIEEMARGSSRTLQVTAPGMKSKTLEVKIPAGVKAGSRVRVPGEGGLAVSGGSRGDLFLKVKVKPHPYYQLDGENLVTEIQVSPAQAVLGGEAVVNTLDGPVTVKIPPGSQSGRLLRLRNRGLPRLKQESRGDHLVRIKLVVPSEPSSEEKALYEQLAKLEKERTSSGSKA